MEDNTTDLKLMESVSPETLIPDASQSTWILGVCAVIALIAIGVGFTVCYYRKYQLKKANLREAAFRDALVTLENIDQIPSRETAVICSLTLRKFLASAADDPALFETHEEFISRSESLNNFTPAAKSACESGFARLASLKYAPIQPLDSPEKIIAESKSLLETLHLGISG